MQPGTFDFNPNFYTRVARTWAFVPDKVKGWFVLAWLGLEELIVWFTWPALVLLRRRFGTRSLSLLIVLQMTAWGVFVLAAIGLGDPLYTAFAVAGAAAGWFHFREARRYERGRGAWRHSYATGEPFLVDWWPGQKTPSEWSVTRFWEPGFVLAVGLVVQFASRPLGFYLVLASVALLLKGHVLFQRMVNQERDRRDGLLVARWAAGAGDDTPPDRAAERFEVRVVRPEVPPEDEEDDAGTEADAAESASEGDPPAGPEGEATPPPFEVVESDERIVATCPCCAARIRVRRVYAGRAASCPRCNSPFRIPSATVAEGE